MNINLTPEQLSLTTQEIEDINSLLDEGYLRKATHPGLPLSIYNYTTQTQFEEYWTPITRMCRGLVLDDYFDIVIRPPEKFFNQGEKFAANIDLSNARISEKLDGYCILVKLDSDWGLIVASRGSFDNKYVEAAKNFITDDVILKMTPDYTYFCELLQNFPGDEAIILTQHPVPKLVCWAIRDENFNEIIPDDECPFPIAKELSLGEAKLYLEQKVEGIVAQDRKTHERIKIKTDYFFEHHRIIADCTKKRVWEVLSNGNGVEELDIPDEFMPRMLGWQQDFLYEYEMTMARIGKIIEKTEDLSDKEFALDPTYSPEMKALVFAYKKHGEDGVSKMIWRKLKPKMI